MRYLSLIPILFALLIAAPLAAQDDLSDPGWPLQERCIGDPTPPPEGWAYTGTIFVQDNDGIRALNPSAKTPYVILFDSDFISAASLSPDGSWYAVPSGHSEPSGWYDRYFIIDAITVVSTGIERQQFRIPWKASMVGPNGSALPKVYWLDRSRIAYPTGDIYDANDTMRVVSPFSEGGESEWRRPLNAARIITPSHFWYFSPDRGRAIFQTESSAPQWSLYDWYSETEVTTIPALELNLNYPAVLWRPDGIGFVAVVTDGSTPGSGSLVAFDYDGNRQGTIFGSGENRAFANLNFSLDGQYLAVGLDVADLYQQVIYDLCVESSRARYGDWTAWSPFARQMAFAFNGDVVVLDFDSWQLYAVGKATGGVVAWGAAQ